MKIKTLKKRKDFVLSNKFGQKSFNKNFILQKFSSTGQNNLDLMFGFTATKKIGNAVKRNRAKRRISGDLSCAFLLDSQDRTRIQISIR